MKTNTYQKSILLFVLFLTAFFNVRAQDEAYVQANNEEISENLDLEAVASIFADSEDLADFEARLNDPEAKINNLDLNKDEYVDYLRVVETADEDVRLVAIQAVLGEDLYQDVATIELEKDEAGEVQVQVVGDVYLYGPNVIVEPIYVYRPSIFRWFWRPYYRPYRSVYYWGYYPAYFKVWRPFRPHIYKKHVHVYINVKHTYHRTTVRRSVTAVNLHTRVRRNDYGKRHPERSYAARVTTRSANGTVRTAAGVNQADGDKYRAAGVNRADGTKKRAVGVNKADGTKKRAAGVNQADGDKYRAAGVKSADGTTKRVTGVNKADGTKKRVASVSNPDGSGKTVAVKRNPNGSKSAVSVKKNSDGTRTVKKAKKSSSKRGKKTATKKTKRKTTKKKNR